MDETRSRNRPSYPPKTPPPPKRPVVPERPSPPSTPVPKKSAVPALRPAAFIRNRRVKTWALENAPWSPGKASRRVVDQLVAWGYCGTEPQRLRFTEVTRVLAEAALGDGGRRISVHVADQDGHALVMVLSHQAAALPDEDFLREVSGLGVASCGSDVNRDDAGNQRWALVAI